MCRRCKTVPPWSRLTDPSETEGRNQMSQDRRAAREKANKFWEVREAQAAESYKELFVETESTKKNDAHNTKKKEDRQSASRRQ